MRSASLGRLSGRPENLRLVRCEKFVAESVYLLQRSAHECRLASPSGKNSEPSSHPPCPVNGNLARNQFVEWIFQVAEVNPRFSGTLREFAIPVTGFYLTRVAHLQ
jgi:hypothetical protein